MLFLERLGIFEGVTLSLKNAVRTDRQFDVFRERVFEDDIILPLDYSVAIAAIVHLDVEE